MDGNLPRSQGSNYRPFYSYPRKILKSFFKRKQKTELEKIEDLELLGFLEKGIKIKMIKMSNQSISVDKPSDIKKVEKYLRRRI